MNKINSNSTSKKTFIGILAAHILLTFIILFGVVLSTDENTASNSSESANSGTKPISVSASNYTTETVSPLQAALNNNAPQTIELNNISSETPAQDTLSVNNNITTGTPTSDNGNSISETEENSDSTESISPLIIPEASSELFESIPSTDVESPSEVAVSFTPEKISQPESTSVLTGRESMKVVSDSFVTDTGGYQEHFTASESVNVFAEDVTNCFTILCAASYNIWGGGTQEAVFNLNKISNSGDTLTFTSGLTSGCCDYIECAIYLDGEEIPYLEFNMNADSAPLTHTIDNLSQHSSMKIVLNNCSGNMNTACFYNFIIE